VHRRPPVRWQAELSLAVPTEIRAGESRTVSRSTVQQTGEWGEFGMRSVVPTIVLLISVLAMSSSAAADDGQIFNGGGGQPSPLTKAEIAQARVKTDFAARYFTYRKAGGMPGRFPEGL